MRVALALAFCGVLLVGYSLLLSPYTDERLFQERYSEMGAGDSDKYFALREQMLTPKYRLLDYGVTVCLMSVIAAVVGRCSPLMAPRQKWPLVAIAVVCPFVFVAGYIFDLTLGASRGEFPHWADSLGIPFAAIPFLFLVTLVWSLLHLAFLVGVRQEAAPLRAAVSMRANPWLLLVSGVTAVGDALLLLDGAYFYAIPVTVWLYFFVSLTAVRRVQHGA